MDILLQNVSIIFSGMLFDKIALITCKGCIFVQSAKLKTYCFDTAAQGQPSKQKHSSKVALGKSCSEKFHKFHRKLPLMKTFHNKLLPVPLEEFHHRCFLMSFAKFWRTFLYSCFKEIVSERKTEWKRVINNIGIIQGLKEHIALH